MEIATESVMEKGIENARKGKPVEEVKVLYLDNCRTTQLSGLTDEYVNLTVLSLINVGLTTLKGFPNLPSLKKLELSDNHLCGTLNLLVGCTNLVHLNLSGNKFKDFEALEPLKDLTKLKVLDLFNCEVASGKDFRKKLFELIPNLQFLDGTDKEDKQNPDSDDDFEDEEDAEGVVELEGNEDSEEEDKDEEGEDSEDEDSEGESSEEDINLQYLTKSGLESESEGEDYQPNGTANDDDEDLDSEEEDEEDLAGLQADGQQMSPAVAAANGGRGVKRKRTEDADAASNGDN